MLLWRVRPHDPQIMLGMLAEVLHFDGVAFQGSFTGSCQVALIISPCEAQGHCAVGTLINVGRAGKKPHFCRSSALSLCCGSCVSSVNPPISRVEWRRLAAALDRWRMQACRRDFVCRQTKRNLLRVMLHEDESASSPTVRTVFLLPSATSVARRAHPLD